MSINVTLDSNVLILVLGVGIIFLLYAWLKSTQNCRRPADERDGGGVCGLNQGNYNQNRDINQKIINNRENPNVNIKGGHVQGIYCPTSKFTQNTQSDKKVEKDD